MWWFLQINCLNLHNLLGKCRMCLGLDLLFGIVPEGLKIARGYLLLLFKDDAHVLNSVLLLEPLLNAGRLVLLLKLKLVPLFMLFTCISLCFSFSPAAVGETSSKFFRNGLRAIFIATWMMQVIIKTKWWTKLTLLSELRTLSRTH